MEPDLGVAAVAVDPDDRGPVADVVVVVGEAVGDRDRREQVVRLGVLLAQAAGGQVPADEDALATASLELDAVQELQPGQRSAVGTSVCAVSLADVNARFSGSGLDTTWKLRPKFVSCTNAIRSARSSTAPTLVGTPRTNTQP
jgi:hypothetical protein